MDPSRFDTVSRLFAQRRLSRRQVMQHGAGALATAGIAQAAAHDVTPAASPVAGESDDAKFLFVQTFGAGSLEPKADASGLLLLAMRRTELRGLHRHVQQHLPGMQQQLHRLGSGDLGL